MIYNFNDYKLFLRSYIEQMPKRGRGVLSRLAAAMDMTSAQMSHVMQGGRDLTLEQALKGASYLGLTTTESDYFIEMVIFARAGTRDLKEFARRRLTVLKGQGLQLKNQVPEHRVLSDAEKAQFYSSWIYSAVRLMSSIQPLQLEQIMEIFALERTRASEIINFLCESGLCVQTDKGSIMGPQTTFVAKNSPFVFKHHANWRLKALEQVEQNREDELYFTSPVSLSQKDFERMMVKITDLIKEFSACVKESPAEAVACLNIDFFHVGHFKK